MWSRGAQNKQYASGQLNLELQCCQESSEVPGMRNRPPEMEAQCSLVGRRQSVRCGMWDGSKLGEQCFLTKPARRSRAVSRDWKVSR